MKRRRANVSIAHRDAVEMFPAVNANLRSRSIGVGRRSTTAAFAYS